MEDLHLLEVSDIVYLVEDNTISKMQIVRTTNKQIVLENNQKFWKKHGEKVGDISASKAKIYTMQHPVVNELYENNIDIYTVIEWLYQLKTLVLTKKEISIDDLKVVFEDLYLLILQYEDY